MKPKKFTKEIWTAIENATEQALAESAKSGHRPIAAFDADGTLWNTDLGESFFRFQIKSCALPALTGLTTDPWTYYRQWKESGDPRPAYLWLAQINQGQSIETVRSWAAANVEQLSPLPIFEAQKELIDYLHKKNVEVFVITASVKWSVEPGAKILGIPESHVLGVATDIKNKIVTDEQSGTITYRDGKPTALLEKTEGRKPYFCCGNTTGDLNLLKAASHLALAVHSSDSQDSELFRAEQALQKEAELQGWLRFNLNSC